MTRSAKASPRVTPKPTPLQSPGVELPPQDLVKIEHHEEKKEAQSETACDNKQLVELLTVDESSQDEVKTEDSVVAVVDEVVQEAQQSEKKEEVKPSGKKSPEPEIKSEVASTGTDLEEQCDMTGETLQIFFI